MDATTGSNTRRFLGSVAIFGSQISQILHNFTSLENRIEESLCELMGNLNATIHNLNQLCSLLSLDEQPSLLFSDEGINYVETLAEECSIAIARINSIVTRNTVYGLNYNPKYWESPVSTDKNGQKVLLLPDLDEVTLFRHLKNDKGNRMFTELWDPAERLEELQLHLLLVVQVVTLRAMTNKSPSGNADLRSIVEYHSRISRAAEMVDIASSDGRALSTRSRRRDFSPLISTDSDSDISVTVRRMPPPPPPRSRSRSTGPRSAGLKNPPLPSAPLPPGWIACGGGETYGRRMPPGWAGCFPPRPFGPPLVPKAAPTSPSDLPRPPSPPTTIEIKDSITTPKDSHPPSYSEKEKEAEDSKVKMEDPSSVPGGQSEYNKPPDGKSLAQKEEEKLRKTSTVSKGAEPSSTGIAGLLNSQSSGLGMKFKSLFRSKSSLEAEMKRTLANDNASLTAFIVHRTEFRKVPHSSFHSLEYTHMRTILSQLRDNSWFKTFSDLTSDEHETLARLLSKHQEDGKFVQRELVVLKVLQQNRFNSWMQIIEECIKSEYTIFPEYENYRIILAIVRERDCGPDEKIDSPVPCRVTEYYDVPRVPRIPEPPSLMTRDSKHVVDLNETRAPVFSRGPPPPPPPGWVAPLRPPFSGSRPEPPPADLRFVPMDTSCVHADITPRAALTEGVAREVLTSYTAFTFRPAPPQQIAAVLVLNLPQPTWSRCFLTRERETRPDLLRRIKDFNSRGDSIIDVKLQLTEPQAAQLTRLIDELNRVERDSRFEHKVVELSMLDQERGLVKRQVEGLSVGVIHVTVQRAPKDDVSALTTYKALMRPAPPPAPEPPIEILEIPARAPPPMFPKMGSGPRQEQKAGKNGWPSVRVTDSSGGDSDSDSDSSTAFTVTTTSSFGYRRKSRTDMKGSQGKRGSSYSESASEVEVTTARWKVDPALIEFGRKQKGMDVVQLLMDRWTPAGEGKGKGKETKGKDENEKREKRKGKGGEKWRKAQVEDFVDYD